MTNTNLATVIPFHREKSSLHSLEVDGTEVQKFIKKATNINENGMSL